jgi:phosphoribosylamine--glycine ligase
LNILVIDSEGLALDFCLRCKDWGHNVKFYVDKYQDVDHRRVLNPVGDGLVAKVRDWRPHMEWADLIFVADNKDSQIKALGPYMHKGYPILAASWRATQLELNRQLGQEVFKKAGIKIIPGMEFKSYDIAIKYVKDTMRRYVSKPNGDADKALSYVSKSPADLVFMLDKWKASNKLKGSFVLQEFVPGIEMAVGGWFGPHGFNKALCENWEFKKFMNDDLGVATGEQGTVLRYVEKSELAEKVLFPLAEELHRLNYIGYVDVNCMIAKDGTPYPLEFTCRPGWPLFQIQQALHRGDPAQWMLDLINGKDTLRCSPDVAVGVVLSMPDYPYHGLYLKDLCGIPIYGVTDKNRKHIYPSFVQKGTAPCMDGNKVVNKSMWVTAGSYVLTVAGTGETVCEAKKKAYKTLDELDMPNSIMYRTDIGHRLEKQLPELQDMGYASDLEYE